MSHYLKSLFISIFLYVSIFALAIYALEESEQFCKDKSESQTNTRVCIAMVEQKTTPEPKKPPEKKKTEPIKKEKKKVVKKPLPKKELAVEKPIKKEIAPVEKAEPETVVEEILKSEQEAVQEEQVVKQEVAQQTQTQKQKTNDDLKAKQDLFLAYLVERINENKTYPNTARRRVIEGDVKMAFNLYADGTVNNIKMLSGKKIFNKSAVEAIAKSFPVNVDSTLFHFPKELTITIAYTLKKF